jgi:hypothetical protein
MIDESAAKRSFKLILSPKGEERLLTYFLKGHLMRSILLALALLTILAACAKKREGGYSKEIVNSNAITGSKPDNTPTPSPTPSPSPTPTPELRADPLTGLPVALGEEDNRPFAVVINNHNKALPQSGIGQASILREVLAEGNITRIVAIFNITDAVKIGPVRSARHYFIDMAFDYDAVFVHHGGSPQGYDAIQSLRINSVDGMVYSGVYLWRDPARVNVPGMYEHSSYTDAQKLKESLAGLKFRDTVSEGWSPGFKFFEQKTAKVGALSAKSILVPFDSGYSAEFAYDEASSTYKKSRNGKPHIDDLTNRQLAVANVIIQRTSIHVIAGDDAGRREVALVGEGTGLLATAVAYVPIKWSKASHMEPTRWFYEDGTEMLMNKGKTWICTVSNSMSITIE